MDAMYHSYILHRRDFRDTSLIIDFFTLEEGLISAVARGAKRPKSSMRGQLQYFTALVISTYGRSELSGLKSVETDASITLVQGEFLLTLLYVNELLCKLLHKHEAHPALFYAYRQFIARMAAKSPIEPNLRLFEMALLTEMGYQLHFNVDARNTPVMDDDYYSFCLTDGLTLLDRNTPATKSYSGAVLKKIQQRDFDDKRALTAAKQLFRDVFAELLQYKTINSRFLFSRVNICKSKIETKSC